MRPNLKSLVVLGWIAIAAFHSWAADNSPVQPIGQFAELFNVPDGGRTDRFWISTPDAASSPAERDGAAWLGKDGQPLPGLSGFGLTNRVLFRTAAGVNPAALQQSHPAGVLSAINSAPGFHSLQFSTVRQAVVAAAKAG